MPCVRSIGAALFHVLAQAHALPCILLHSCPTLQDLANKHAAELNMQTVPSLNIAYTEERGYVTADVAKAENLHVLNLSGTKFRQMLRAGDDIPEWFAFKSVVQVLREQIMSEAN